MGLLSLKGPHILWDFSKQPHLPGLLQRIRAFAEPGCFRLPLFPVPLPPSIWSPRRGKEASRAQAAAFRSPGSEPPARHPTAPASRPLTPKANEALPRTTGSGGTATSVSGSPWAPLPSLGWWGLGQWWRGAHVWGWGHTAINQQPQLLCPSLICVYIGSKLSPPFPVFLLALFSFFPCLSLC